MVAFKQRSHKFLLTTVFILTFCLVYWYSDLWLILQELQELISSLSLIELVITTLDQHWPWNTTD
jgi:hypothetical protein